MLGLSTAWKSAEVESGKELLENVVNLGADALELEYRISSDILREMIHEMKRQSVSVLSIHNFCPIPDSIPRAKASANIFLLSSHDKEERLRAIKYSLKTIQLAHEHEVQAVIFHVGHVNMDHKKDMFFELYDRGEIDTPLGRSFIEEQLVLRKKARQKNLDSVFFSLEKLNKEAEKLDVYIGVENRYHYHEIPNSEEIGMILREFQGSHIRYWHDVGHADVQEKFGILSHEELLASYSSKLLGIHIHDIKGYDDHYAPGNGEFDFQLIKKYLTPKTIKIVEVHPKVSREELVEGIRFLKGMGIG
ncbi:MAG: TIM barrel protein [Thermodesulfobacteriota bacterium]|nr:TIM barrel protein [Thermodesulfobacteriota bacterium]